MDVKASVTRECELCKLSFMSNSGSRKSFHRLHACSCISSITLENLHPTPLANDRHRDRRLDPPPTNLCLPFYVPWFSVVGGAMGEECGPLC